VWRITVKGLRAHKLRLALTALAIVLGVTFVTGTLVLTDTLNNTFTTLFGQVYQNINFEVRGVAAFPTSGAAGAIRKPIPESIIAAVKDVPGVAVAEGGVSGYAQFIAPNGKAVTTGGAPTIGLSYGADRRLSSLRLVAGKPPTTSTQVVMDQGTARKYHFSVGNQVRILLPGSPQTFTLSGIVAFGTADNLAGATIAAFNLPTAQQLFGEQGHLNTIDVITTPNANKTAVEHGISAVLPAGVEVVTGQTVAAEQSSAINQSLGIFSTALLVFALISLFVGGFTIFNTFSITVGQRTRELALLRIVGASRRQVFRSVLFEALLLGVTASLVGIGLGVLTASGLEALIKAFGITLPSGSLVFQSRTVFAGLLVGVGVTVVSAISPARQAVKIPPIAAMSTYEVAQRESSARRLTIGAVIGVAGIVVLAIGLSQPAIQLVGIGAVGIFIAVGILAPAIARPVSSVLGRPLARILGVSGRIGRKNSMRSPRRTAQTSAALMVGMALVSTIAVYGASLSKSATGTVSDAVSADYIITAPATGGPNTGFSLGTTEAVAKVPGVTRVTNVNSGQLEISRSLATLSSLAPSDLSSTVILKMSSGAAAKSLAEGQLLIDTNTANTNHLSVGSVVPVTFAETGPTTMRIGGIFKPNALLGSYLTGSAFFHTHFAATTLPVALLLATSTGATPPTSAAVKAALRGYPNLTVQTRAEFQKTQQTSIDQLLGLIYALLALAILIALIGIVNTLMLSVFERTHEIGLLRAVGMRRRQIRAMIRSEALILSVFGALIGVVVGTGLGVALADSLKQQGITDIVIPFTNLVIFLLLAALLGLGAATWPARRAARLNVLEAIATE
jgi:putative ABC transport system permease protein